MTQTKLSFQPVQPDREVKDEFPVDRTLIDSLDASLPTEVLAQFDPTAATPKANAEATEGHKLQLLPFRIKQCTEATATMHGGPIDTLMRTIANYQSSSRSYWQDRTYQCPTILWHRGSTTQAPW